MNDKHFTRQRSGRLKNATQEEEYPDNVFGTSPSRTSIESEELAKVLCKNIQIKPPRESMVLRAFNKIISSTPKPARSIHPFSCNISSIGDSHGSNTKIITISSTDGQSSREIVGGDKLETDKNESEKEKEKVNNSLKLEVVLERNLSPQTPKLNISNSNRKVLSVDKGQRKSPKTRRGSILKSKTDSPKSDMRKKVKFSRIPSLQKRSAKNIIRALIHQANTQSFEDDQETPKRSFMEEVSPNSRKQKGAQEQVIHTSHTDQTVCDKDITLKKRNYSRQSRENKTNNSLTKKDAQTSIPTPTTSDKMDETDDEVSHKKNSENIGRARKKKSNISFRRNSFSKRRKNETEQAIQTSLGNQTGCLDKTSQFGKAKQSRNKDEMDNVGTEQAVQTSLSNQTGCVDKTTQYGKARQSRNKDDIDHVVTEQAVQTSLGSQTSWPDKTSQFGKARQSRDKDNIDNVGTEQAVQTSLCSQTGWPDETSQFGKAKQSRDKDKIDNVGIEQAVQTSFPERTIGKSNISANRNNLSQDEKVKANNVSMEQTVQTNLSNRTVCDSLQATREQSLQSQIPTNLKITQSIRDITAVSKKFSQSLLSHRDNNVLSKEYSDSGAYDKSSRRKSDSHLNWLYQTISRVDVDLSETGDFTLGTTNKPVPWRCSIEPDMATVPICKPVGMIDPSVGIFDDDDGDDEDFLASVPVNTRIDLSGNEQTESVNITRMQRRKDKGKSIEKVVKRLRSYSKLHKRKMSSGDLEYGSDDFEEDSVFEGPPDIYDTFRKPKIPKRIYTKGSNESVHTVDPQESTSVSSCSKTQAENVGTLRQTRKNTNNSAKKSAFGVFTSDPKNPEQATSNIQRKDPYGLVSSIETQDNSLNESSCPKQASENVEDHNANDSVKRSTVDPKTSEQRITKAQKEDQMMVHNSRSLSSKSPSSHFETLKYSVMKKQGQEIFNKRTPVTPTIRTRNSNCRATLFPDVRTTQNTVGDSLSKLVSNDTNVEFDKLIGKKHVDSDANPPNVQTTDVDRRHKTRNTKVSTKELRVSIERVTPKSKSMKAKERKRTKRNDASSLLTEDTEFVPSGLRRTSRRVKQSQPILMGGVFTCTSVRDYKNIMKDSIVSGSLDHNDQHYKAYVTETLVSKRSVRASKYEGSSRKTSSKMSTKHQTRRQVRKLKKNNTSQKDNNSIFLNASREKVSTESDNRPEASCSTSTNLNNTGKNNNDVIENDERKKSQNRVQKLKSPDSSRVLKSPTRQKSKLKVMKTKRSSSQKSIRSITLNTSSEGLPADTENLPDSSPSRVEKPGKKNNKKHENINYLAQLISEYKNHSETDDNGLPHELLDFIDPSDRIFPEQVNHTAMPNDEQGNSQSKDLELNSHDPRQPENGQEKQKRSIWRGENADTSSSGATEECRVQKELKALQARNLAHISEGMEVDVQSSVTNFNCGCSPPSINKVSRKCFGSRAPCNRERSDESLCEAGVGDLVVPCLNTSLVTKQLLNCDPKMSDEIDLLHHFEVQKIQVVNHLDESEFVPKDQNCSMTKSVKSAHNAYFNFIQIPPRVTKPLARLNNGFKIFTVYEGFGRVQIHSSISIIKPADQFLVPTGVAYSITNGSKTYPLGLSCITLG